MEIIQILFMSSLVMILYAYVGYPVVLWCMTALKTERPLATNSEDLPIVSLLISAYNEEAAIREKLHNSLGLDYPKERLEIVVISDGSTDSTNAIVTEYSQKGVVLKHYEGRIGKTACLNKAIDDVSGDIVIFSDANSMYPPDVVRALIAPFADPIIGFVSGGTSYVADKNGRMGESIGIYAKIERATKLLESRLGSCVGADGAMFAIRRVLYQPLDRADINDLVIPLKIVKAGFRGIYTAHASCVEIATKETAREFTRQVRIAARTIRAVMAQRALLNPIEYGLFSFQLASHKLCKLFVPFLLLVAFVSNAVLVGASPVYLVLLILQVLVYTTAWVTARGSAPDSSESILARLMGVVQSFIVVNVAIGVAWVCYWRGDSFTTWAPAR